MTDRELAAGFLNVLIAIGEKLTGEKMLVKIRTGNDLVSIGGTDGSVTWLSATEGRRPHCETQPESLHSGA